MRLDCSADGLDELNQALNLFRSESKLWASQHFLIFGEDCGGVRRRQLMIADGLDSLRISSRRKQGGHQHIGIEHDADHRAEEARFS